MLWAIRFLNLPEAYTINYIDINTIGAWLMAANRKGEPGYENCFRNRPLSGGCDLPCFRPQRLPELHSPAPAGRHRGTVHGCPVRLAFSVGDLWVSGHRSGASAGQPLRTVGGGGAGAGDRQHSLFSRFYGPYWASAGPL